MSKRGCEFCSDDQNMDFGHVEQIARSELRGSLLLRCRQGNWVHELPADGVAEPQHISGDEARDWFNV